MYCAHAGEYTGRRFEPQSVHKSTVYKTMSFWWGQALRIRPPSSQAAKRLMIDRSPQQSLWGHGYSTESWLPVRRSPVQNHVSKPYKATRGSGTSCPPWLWKCTKFWSSYHQNSKFLHRVFRYGTLRGLENASSSIKDLPISSNQPGNVTAHIWPAMARTDDLNKLVI